MNRLISAEPFHSGLHVDRADAEVPLRGVRIDATLTGPCSRVTVVQRYENTGQVPVEAVYVFPMESGSAVCGFEARIGDRRIEGRVEQRDTAFEIYDDAMAEGHGAMLLDQERPDVFTVSVGNLEPGTELEIAITYVALLRPEGPAWRLRLPTTVSPRYVPAPDAPEIGQPAGERVNPEHRLSVPYGLTLTVEVEATAGNPLASVESPSHTVRTKLSPDGGATVTLTRDEAALDRDFVLLVELQRPHEPLTRVAREADGTRVALVQFVPDAETLGEAGKREVTFVLDCSGSMSGTSIGEAKQALALCLRALQEGDTFDIVCFGSSYTQMWGTPRPYTQQALDEATAYLERVDASMGGTEILRPLQAILGRPVDPKRARQVLLLTDGQVSNEEQVIALCGEKRDSARIFSFGIGAGVSEHLVRGTARASGGAAELIYPGERIEPKVLRMFGRLRQPTLSDIKLEWGAMQVEQAPAQLPSVFAGEPLTVFARIKAGDSREVVLKAHDGDKTRQWNVALDLERAEADGPMPALWARQRIEDLEDGAAQVRHGSNQSRRRSTERVDPAEATNQKIVELGKRYGLMSSQTSYVAVELRAESERTTGQAELRKIPVALTTGWGGHGVAQSSVAPAMPAAMPAPGGAPMFDAMPAEPSRGFGGGGNFASAPPPAQPAPARRERSAKKKSRGGLLGKVFGRKQEAQGKMLSAQRPLPDPAVSAPEMLSLEESSARFDAEEGGGGSDLFYEVLMAQRADGHFPAGALLEQLCANHREALRQALAQHDGAVVATAIVLRWLETRQADRRDEWQAAATKARRWLERLGASFDAAQVIG